MPDINTDLRNFLIEKLARKGSDTSYQSVNDEFFANYYDLNSQEDRKELGHELGIISQYEVEHGRPMLSSLVKHKGGLPGRGFFNLAEELGIYDKFKEKNDKSFWQKERNRVIGFWKNYDNYSKYRAATD